MTEIAATDRAAARRLVLPLALAQFIASYAATNMNVAISDIAHDLDTTISALQTTITLFTLTMAALMIPGSKLTDIWGRKRCFLLGLVVYGAGGLLATLAWGIGALMVGYSLLEGVGSALMIPPIYILITVAFDDVRTRARYFGVVSGAAGLGAATGPLLGGFLTSALSWRASFLGQVLVVAWVLLLARKITDRPREGAAVPGFDVLGAVLSGAAMVCLVLGFLSTSTYGWLTASKDLDVGGRTVIPEGSLAPVWWLLLAGAGLVLWFFLHVRRGERSGREVLLRLRLFRNRTANLGLGTQLAQWLTMQGSFFVISVFLQDARDFSAIETGLMLTPATAGILIAAARAERMAQRLSQRSLVVAGFACTALGMALLLALVRSDSGFWSFLPGLLLMGLGLGVMLTASVNVVQSSFPDSDQGDISGLSRSLSNLGSSLGVAIAGSVLVAAQTRAGHPFGVALGVLTGFALLGLLLAWLIPRDSPAGRLPDRA
ncbi:MFS transporter [Nocardioides panaciterrulae]|uniref:MFS family permease n=1 Tax=Nocardioides panaciterrulae TaxID=661492 RepID=A0A7Y9E5K9_9ACTN|nr:MFS transporter [Nocardioides panaciterrulae]NYD41412.1 MFS family permease [Nocardioides panaciterrulae]